MKLLHAEGQLRHRFWGEYSTLIGLTFDNEQEAAAAHRALGVDWKPVSVQGSLTGLVWQGSSSALDAVKELLRERYNLTIAPCGFRHCTTQCKNASIDSVAHSIDYGPAFTLEIPVEEEVPEQLSLFEKVGGA